MGGADRVTRAVLVAALAAGVSYLAVDEVTLPPAMSLAWKGAGLGLLAVFAAIRARGFDGWLVFTVMAAGAAGDVLLGAAGFIVGGGAFLISHIVAIGL